MPGRAPPQRLGSLEHRGRRVAFATVGGGPPLVCDLGRLHHLDVFWRYPRYRHLVETLARTFTVIRFDRPGCGLSDRGADDFTVAGELALFERLAGELRLDRVAVLAAGSSVPAMIAVSARIPGLVSRLALFGARQPAGRSAHPGSEALDMLLRHLPALAIDVLARRTATGCEADAVRWLSGAWRQSASDEVIAAWLREGAALDVSDDLGRISCPTLLVLRRGDRLVEFQQARDVAARIPEAVLVPLDGAESIIWEGDHESLLPPLLRFLADPAGPGPAAPDVVLTAREREVAALVAEGLTNAEIAARLEIGRRTVESHLERARSRLRLRSRADLAAWTVLSGTDRR